MAEVSRGWNPDVVEDVVIEIDADTPGEVSKHIHSTYDVSRVVGSICYQFSRYERRWGFNPLRWLLGPRKVVKVWRAWFRYRV